MSRRKNQANRAKPKSTDSRFNSINIEELIRNIMKSGKKQKAINIVYGALDDLHQYCNKKGDILSSIEDDKDSTQNKEESVASSSISKKDAYISRVFDSILDKAGPSLELKNRKIGGSNIQVPHSVDHERKNTLAIRFIIKCSRDRISQNKSMVKALSNELIGIISGSAESLNLRDRMLSMAKANAVFQVAKRG